MKIQTRKPITFSIFIMSSMYQEQARYTWRYVLDDQWSTNSDVTVPSAFSLIEKWQTDVRAKQYLFTSNNNCLFGIEHLVSALQGLINCLIMLWLFYPLFVEKEMERERERQRKKEGHMVLKSRPIFEPQNSGFRRGHLTSMLWSGIEESNLALKPEERSSYSSPDIYLCTHTLWIWASKTP